MKEEEKDMILEAVVRYLNDDVTLEIALRNIIAYCQNRYDEI